MAEFTFGQIDAVLANLNHIAEHKRVAFTSRLKHLQKSGLGYAAPGRGKVGSYDFNQLMKMALGVEFLQAGLPPALAAQAVRNSSGDIYTIVGREMWRDQSRTDWVARDRAAKLLPGDLLLAISPEGLADLTLANDLHPSRRMAQVIDVDQLTAETLFDLSYRSSAKWRTLLVNASHLSRHVAQLVSDRFRFSEKSAIVEETEDRAIRRYNNRQRFDEATVFVVPDELDAEALSFVDPLDGHMIPSYFMTDAEQDSIAATASREHKDLLVVIKESLELGSLNDCEIWLPKLVEAGLIFLEGKNARLSYFGRKVLRAGQITMRYEDVRPKA